MSASRQAALPLEYSPELKLLLACIAHPPGDELAAAMAPYQHAELDWPYLLELAGRHQLTPLLRRGLASWPGDAVPTEIAARFQRAHFAATATAMLLTSELQAILTLLHDHDIPAMPYKGVFLGEQLYGDASLRPTSDIDLIVRADDVMRAKECLAQHLGYTSDFAFHSPAQEALYLQRIHHYGLVQPRKHILVEIHWDAVGPGHDFAINWAEIWSRAESVTWRGTVVQQLAAEDHFILLAIHGSKHQWDTLKWLADVDALMQTTPTLDWSVIAARAASWRGQRAVQLTRLLAQSLLHSESMPHEPVNDSVYALAAEVNATLDTATPRANADWQRLAFNLKLQDTARGRLHLVRSWLFGLNFQDMEHADSSRAAAYLHRPLRLLRKRGPGGVADILQNTWRGLWRG